MKKYPLFLVGIFLSVSNLFCQWEVKYAEMEFDKKLNVIKAINDSTIIAMGEQSTILRSFDQGENWENSNLNIDIDIYDFESIGDSILIAAGNPYIVKSFDLGLSWSILNTNQGSSYNKIIAISDSILLLTGQNSIQKSINQGETWQLKWSLQNEGYLYGQIGNIHLINQDTGFVTVTARTDNVPQGFQQFILQTQNQGENWQLSSQIGTNNSSLPGLEFVNENAGYIHEYNGNVFITNDQGQNWNIQGESTFGITDIDFISLDRGFATCEFIWFVNGGGPDGAILTTNNQGQDWETLYTNGIPLYDVFFQNDSTGFVIGHYALIMKYNPNIEGIEGDYPDIPSSTNELDKQKLNVQIAPNPFHDFIQIKSNQKLSNLKISVFDSAGKEIFNRRIHQQHFQLNTEQFPKGIYLLSIQSNDKIKTFKLVKG